MNLNIVVLAAGQGKRMNSTKPKVLHEVGGKPILVHVLEVAKKLNPSKLIVIYGHGGDQVRELVTNSTSVTNINWVYQQEQLGTGHALQQALPYLDENGATLVLYGDVPLINENTLLMMQQKYDSNLIILTMNITNPFGYGRVIRDVNNKIVKIVEEKDANTLEKYINEINTGVYLLPNNKLSNWLKLISNNNHQNEYYLTDVVEIAYNEGRDIDYVESLHEYEILGVNNKVQLEELERMYNRLNAIKLMEAGVTIKDKSRVEVRGSVHAGKDCTIDINCVLEGNIELGNNVNIGIGVILKNVKIYDNVNIKPYSIIEDATIGSNCQIGPYARIRPDTNLSEGVHIGNFVEIKKSNIGVGSKVNHLTYIGDTEIGSKVNVGAGSVTCNYDGTNKFKTVIRDNVFVGSGTMMVAPVTLGEGSIIGAGSTITKDTPENELTVARAKQQTVMGWLKRNKK